MFENVTLEMSLKPFRRTDDEYIRAVAAHVFSSWRPLLKNRSSISILLWVGDGSEILDYAKDLEAQFEWARFLGTANLEHIGDDDPPETSLHQKKQDYIPNAPKMTYGILKRIVSIIKEEGSAAFPNAVIRVGETFDIGPEFAISEFRYVRHPEICTGSSVESEEGVHKMIEATALFHKDDRRYAAYPDGIPEGLAFGSFLGAQAQIFLEDMGFDYLWLSNGLGFSSDPWKKTGKIFDGEKYYYEKLKVTKEKVFAFWKLFREKCSFPVETRGTNNSVGIDYASDGVPLYDIYTANLDITAPPNSPWAALNDNYGLELMGHMTRIANLPGKKFPFRYYIHDPWWVNSPWYDRYDGSPCDIYLPMAISRLDASGKTESANTFSILAIDNSYGEMPDACVNEPLPHILKAEKDFSDEPAPLVWIYPMREYTTSEDAELLREMNLGDSFIMNAINDGLPLCCVCSTDNFKSHRDAVYKKSIIISPVPIEQEIFDKLSELKKSGIPTLIYGTKQSLATLTDTDGFILIDTEESPSRMREALAPLGYSITFTKKQENAKPPTITLSRHDNALFFSIYNSNTTTNASFRFPFGAPILIGREAEIISGSSSYCFTRGEHRECRVYVDQIDGVVSCREAPPVNARYRRAIKITGLCDATVCLFSEHGRECAVSTASRTDFTPEYDPRFTEHEDPIYGKYLRGEHVTGSIYFLIGR